ncbi:MAG: PaaI family thioesterase [Pacificimonas sp.]
MSFAALAERLASGEGGPLNGIPYAEMLGLSVSLDDDGALLTMPYDRSLIGSPQPPRLHGGTVAGLMEIASIAQLLHALGPGEAEIKPINVTVDYLRAGQPVDTFARAKIVRMGRRIANVRVSAWQDDQANPIAGAHMNVMLVRQAA